ncbi:MAG TPA: hypothetical protein VHH15_04420, partial [Actinophytocola sp.]|nr:hypothetical protein [Actinophytocola sp.]
MITAAASRPTSTSSGAANRAGTRNVFSDSVGIRLISSAPMATVQTITTGPADHQPSRPTWMVRISGSSASSPPAGAGTPTKNSLAYGGCSV